jgi:ribosomal protein S27AE
MNRLTEQQRKERKNQLSKEYYHKNKDSINQKMRKPEACPNCGKVMTKRQIYRHRKKQTCLDRQKLIEKAKQQAIEEYKNPTTEELQVDITTP